jgi:hypothetical protein
MSPFGEIRTIPDALRAIRASPWYLEAAFLLPGGDKTAGAD